MFPNIIYKYTAKPNRGKQTLRWDGQKIRFLEEMLKFMTELDRFDSGR